jgi:hypothetical protein
LYSNKGLPLYVYRLQISCKKCIHQWNKEGNFEHGGECYRTKGCTNIMLVEPQGSQQLGQDLMAGNLEFYPHTTISDGDSRAFSQLQKELPYTLHRVNCYSHVTRNSNSALNKAAVGLHVKGWSYNR